MHKFDKCWLLFISCARRSARDAAAQLGMHEKQIKGCVGPNLHPCRPMPQHRAHAWAPKKSKFQFWKNMFLRKKLCHLKHFINVDLRWFLGRAGVCVTLRHSSACMKNKSRDVLDPIYNHADQCRSTESMPERPKLKIRNSEKHGFLQEIALL